MAEKTHRKKQSGTKAQKRKKAVNKKKGVGKTTLIKALIKHWTRQDVKDVKGPITLVAGKARRLTFIECPQDLSATIDASKYADLVLLLVDGAFGFEMETFEFLNMLQVHGFPKVMGVLTHLDGYKDTKALKKTKKSLKHRFWSEIYQGMQSGWAKLFYLSGMRHGKYLKREILNLARFISVMKFRPLSWRMEHPFLVADRFEDVTDPASIKADPKADRDVTLYGYVRGTNWRAGSRIEELTPLPDPCPLPATSQSGKRRSLSEKDRLLYAPMSDVGGLLYDADAMYIDIPDWKVQYSAAGAANGRADGETMIRELASTRHGIDEQLQGAEIQVFKGAKPLPADGAASSDEEENEDESADESGDEAASTGGSGSSDDESEGGSDSDEEGEPHQRDSLPGQEVVLAADGRHRRRAVFSTTLEPRAGSGENSSDENSGSDSDDEPGTAPRSRGALEDDEEGSDPESGSETTSNEEGGGEDDDGDEDEEGLGAAARWKAAMLERAAALFSHRAANLHAAVYGERAVGPPASQRLPRAEPEAPSSDGDEDDDGDLFRPREAARGMQGPPSGLEDCSRAWAAWDATLAAWADDAAVEGLRNRFVTGDWAAAEERSAARPRDGGAGADEDPGSEEEEVYGDFEDVETGDRFEGSADPATRAAAAAIKLSAEEERKELDAKRASKKAAFDAEYDQGGSRGVKDGTGGGKASSKTSKEDVEEEGETYYDALKKDLAERQARTDAALSTLGPDQRLAMEGHRPGDYVRLRFRGLPCELVRHFDPRSPVLVGGLGGGEEGVGCQQVRLKRHRWFPRILKNRDPLVVSVGWRRYQALPVYGMQDNNGRHRMLKYTPEHAHCLAAWWGPLAPPGTGVLAVQKLHGEGRGWRIAATGVVLSLDASLRIVKKLKLILRHTAFVSGMFNSELEAAKFEGAGIRTVSGIRGTIKKALRAGVQGAKDGTFRATFEDKPLLSDMIFLRTVADLRREQGVGAPRESDSLYRAIERKPRVFNPLKIPKNLQAALPFKSKPKTEAARKRKSLEQRRAVVLEPEEKRAATLLNQLNAIRNAKAGVRREARQKQLKQLAKRREAEEAWRAQFNKEERKKRYVEQGQQEKRAAKKARAN
ncbi:hypothetical protein APUTEX25_000676 [Auxenochlorella protothecoides]|uniref:Bms1-type G domain-containing protein n=1 Tax=Auxenochlorella protothecoides TaxID=3075 RepID=A0A3M7KPC7_AUXPR|nr:hypothetical protein APUTEX25_000676 [Auxenochlorella protothecoides]|eukprot:RMZ52401.1 hypothetical protein APUTEX25_000676 [Auxenochlorella protothecoides]